MGYLATITADGKTLYETKEGNSRVVFDAVMNYRLFKGGIFEITEEKIRECVKEYRKSLLRFAEYELQKMKTVLTLINKGKCVNNPPAGMNPNAYFVEDEDEDFIIGFGIEEYYKLIGKSNTDVPKFFEENKLNMSEAIVKTIENFQKAIAEKENHIKEFEKFLREISAKGETEIRVFNHTLTNIPSNKKFKMDEPFCLYIIMGYEPLWMVFDSKEDSLAEFKESLKYMPKDKYFADRQNRLKQMISRAKTVVIDASY